MMVRHNQVKRKLDSGAPVHGLFCTIPDPHIVEMIACGGYDFVILDTEHTLIDPDRLVHLIRTAEASGITPFVRVPAHDPGAILRALDAGAMGIVLPQVRSRADISAAVEATYYAPVGMRSLGIGRTNGFGLLDPAADLHRANSEIMLIALIEDAAAVDDIDYILAGGCVDMVMPGPADLSQSLGIPWQLGDPKIRHALRRLHNACAKHDVPYCAMARTSERYGYWRAADVRAFVCGDATALAAAALRRSLTDLRG